MPPLPENVLATHMGKDFEKLSPLLQQVHTGESTLSGSVKVTRGGILANIICSLFGFPKASENSFLTVTCSHSENSMFWHRNFDGLIMESTFSRKGEFLIEHLGPLNLYFKALEKDGQLHYAFSRTVFCGIPLPSFLCPKIIANEKEQEGVYQFEVKVAMLIIGDVLAYGGCLTVK